MGDFNKNEAATWQRGQISNAV